MNFFGNLKYETALENLGNDYFDEVLAAEFPQHILRFRNDALLPLLGLNPQEIIDEHFIEAFGQFQGIRPFLALRYHGYQFGEYNPYLGDGRGFIYGQVRGIDGKLYDFGTKGSGRTPYSRTADGRLTLKGGVREVLAAEALYQLGVRTSRCLSLVETGESLWRGDEPSPTRSSVMIRVSNSHIRFGTFERLFYIQRADLIQKLLDHVIDFYYPEIDKQREDKYADFYSQLVKRVAELAAQWMAAGFCHGVLNTDNMSITGESFDYGPYGFIPNYDTKFVAAYFDYGGRYSYGNQPLICQLNLEMLQQSLSTIVNRGELKNSLAEYENIYSNHYLQLMMGKLGLEKLSDRQGRELLEGTIKLLKNNFIGYHDFFATLARDFNVGWQENRDLILENASFSRQVDGQWKILYQQAINQFSGEEIEKKIKDANPQTALLRPIIESVWEPIAQEDNWQPFYELVEKIQNKQ